MKERRTTDVSVVVTAPTAYWQSMAPEVVARCKAREKRELEEFIEHAKNHRDLDGFVLELVEKKQDVCSHCGREWEEWEGDDPDGGYEDGMPVCCLAAQDEWHVDQARQVKS